MNPEPRIRMSIRIDLPNGGRFGPGKAALLQALSLLGSLNKAAADLGMSYPRARKLIEEMNQDFEAPLVSAMQGGADGGGSHLTDLGQEILRLYYEVCDAAETANGGPLSRFSRKVRGE